MVHDYLSLYSNDNKDDTFELLEQSQTGQRSNLDTINDNMIRPASRLPAKQFPLRSATQTVRSMFWVGCIAVATITTLSIIASKITNYIPDTSSFSPTDGISCDLLFQNGSSFQHAFTIDLRGSTYLTFPQAKAIDVVWQLFVGMGGRLVMALVAYIVFMDGLARIMEDSAISYQLYASLTFSTTSLLTTGSAVKGVMATKGWRGKMFLAWVAISSIYVLGFPTLISATAGYLKPSTAGFKIDNSTFLTPDSPALKSCYEVSDGALIGLQNGTIVQGPPVSQLNVVGNVITVQDGNLSGVGIPNFQQDYPVFASLFNSE